jgi:hypothetical protein
VERGREAFRFAGCSKCHGETGRADGPLAGSLKDSRGHALVVPSFQLPFLFIGGERPEDIYRTMMTGLDGTPMPRGLDFFRGGTAWDVVEFIVAQRDQVAGDRPR